MLCEIKTTKSRFPGKWTITQLRHDAPEEFKTLATNPYGLDRAIKAASELGKCNACETHAEKKELKRKELGFQYVRSAPCSIDRIVWRTWTVPPLIRLPVFPSRDSPTG